MISFVYLLVWLGRVCVCCLFVCACVIVCSCVCKFVGSNVFVIVLCVYGLCIVCEVQRVRLVAPLCNCLIVCACVCVYVCVCMCLIMRLYVRLVACMFAPIFLYVVAFA